MVALLVGCAWLLLACGGGDDGQPQRADKVLHYRSGLHLKPKRTPRPNEGSLRIEKVTYSSVDGKRVPALFAIPTVSEPLACLIYQGGFGATKEALPELRRGLADARLATFTIDPRNVGDRGSAEEAASAIVTPEGLRSMVVDTVADLRVALDYLGRRPECKKNIGYLGSSFGAYVGVLLAAQDARIKGTVLAGMGATYEQLLLVRPLAAKEIENLPDYVPQAASDPKVLRRAVRILSPYDPETWIGRISPRPVMLLNGRYDPVVLPGDAMQIAAAAETPRTISYYNGGHDPFARGPALTSNLIRIARFLVTTLNLPYPI